MGALVDDRILRDGFLELRIGDDDVAGIDVGRFDAAFVKGGSNNAAGDAFAEADDEVGDARREFENGGEAAQDFVERIEFLIDEGDERRPESLSRAQAVSRWRQRRRELMARAPVRSPQAAAAGGAQQLVGHLGHGADHDDRVLAEGDAAGDDASRATDCGRVFDRGAAELHHHKLMRDFSLFVVRFRHARGFDDRIQFAEVCEQLGVQDGGSGSAAHGVVREQDELPVEQAAGTETADGDGHAFSAIAIEARLGAIGLLGKLNRLLGREGQVFAGQRRILHPTRPESVRAWPDLRQLDGNALGVTVDDGHAIAMC